MFYQNTFFSTYEWEHFLSSDQRSCFENEFSWIFYELNFIESNLMIYGHFTFISCFQCQIYQKPTTASKKRLTVVFHSVNISYHDFMPDNMTDRGIFGIWYIECPLPEKTGRNFQKFAIFKSPNFKHSSVVIFHSTPCKNLTWI